MRGCAKECKDGSLSRREERELKGIAIKPLTGFNKTRGATASRCETLDKLPLRTNGCNARMQRQAFGLDKVPKV